METLEREHILKTFITEIADSLDFSGREDWEGKIEHILFNYEGSMQAQLIIDFFRSEKSAREKNIKVTLLKCADNKELLERYNELLK
jgi:hypothetical protein